MTKADLCRVEILDGNDNSIAIIPSPETPVDTSIVLRDPEAGEVSKREMQIRSACWWSLVGALKNAEVADRIGVSTSTIERWKNTPQWKAAAAHYSTTDEKARSSVRAALASRQPDYLAELDHIACDANVAPHVRVTALESLLDRDRTIPKKPVDEPAALIGIPVEALERIGAAIAHGLRAQRENGTQVIEASAKRVG